MRLVSRRWRYLGVFGGRRGEQIFRQFTNPKPLDLFTMLSERFLEHALMLRDVVEHVFRLYFLFLAAECAAPRIVRQVICDTPKPIKSEGSRHGNTLSLISSATKIGKR